MSRKRKLFQVDAFTDTKFSGNPAGVVLDADGLTDDEMQAIARELNNSETAFLLKPEGKDHELAVRFFTPSVEVAMCGHATVGLHAARVIAGIVPAGKYVQKTKAGLIPVDIRHEHGRINVVMTQPRPTFDPPLQGAERDAILSALGVDAIAWNEKLPVQGISTGNRKMMVAVKTREQLNRLTPDFETLATLGKKLSATGYFVFTLDSDEPSILTHGRMFGPQLGINEDPVTGMAHGPLGAYVYRHQLAEHDNKNLRFTGKQGEAMGRSGLVQVDVRIENGEAVSVDVGGTAVIAFEAQI